MDWIAQTTQVMDPVSGDVEEVGTGAFEVSVNGFDVVLREKSLGLKHRCFYRIERDGGEVADGNCSSRGAAEAAIRVEVGL